jgi:predicted phage tail protein
LQEGITYDFYASAYNSAGLESDLSAPVTHTVSSSSINLVVSWDRSFSANAASYAVFYSPTNQATLTRQNSGTNLSASISNVVRGTTYEITAEAYNSSGSVVTEYEDKVYTIPQSGSIGSVHLLPIDEPPVVALNSPANASNYTEPASIQINASASDDDAIQFVDLFAGTNLLARLTSSPYAFTWVNVPDGEYEIYANAVDSLNQFTRSGSAFVTVQETSPTATPPSAPENLSGRYNKNTGGVRLTWTDMANNEDSFAIERSLDGSSFSVTATIPANTQSFTDLNIQRGNRYFYRVRAVNGAGSNISSVISVRVR